MKLETEHSKALLFNKTNKGQSLILQKSQIFQFSFIQKKFRVKVQSKI